MYLIQDVFSIDPLFGYSFAFIIVLSSNAVWALEQYTVLEFCLFIHPYYAVLGRTVSAVTHIIAIAHAAVETR